MPLNPQLSFQFSILAKQWLENKIKTNSYNDVPFSHERWENIYGSETKSSIIMEGKLVPPEGYRND